MSTDPLSLRNMNRSLLARQGSSIMTPVVPDPKHPIQADRRGHSHETDRFRAVKASREFSKQVDAAGALLHYIVLGKHLSRRERLMHAESSSTVSQPALTNGVTNTAKLVENAVTASIARKDHNKITSTDSVLEAII